MVTTGRSHSWPRHSLNNHSAINTLSSYCYQNFKQTKSYLCTGEGLEYGDVQGRLEPYAKHQLPSSVFKGLCLDCSLVQMVLDLLVYQAGNRLTIWFRWMNTKGFCLRLNRSTLETVVGAAVPWWAYLDSASQHGCLMGNTMLVASLTLETNPVHVLKTKQLAAIW